MPLDDLHGSILDAPHDSLDFFRIERFVHGGVAAQIRKQNSSGPAFARRLQLARKRGGCFYGRVGQSKAACETEMGMRREKFLTTRTVLPQRRPTLRTDGCTNGIAGVSTGHHLERLN